MGRPAKEERMSEWSFTESLTLDDVDIRERDTIEDREVRRVSYAFSIQGRESSKITYRELRKVCSYLGVRYYKNRSKDVMLELIAQKKLKGQVPESYKLVKKTERPKDVDILSETQPLFISPKRQRVATDEAVADAITTSPSATNTFLQPASPSERRSLSPDYDESGIPTTPTEPEPPRIHADMALKHRADLFNLLRQVRKQIQDVEEEVAAHVETDEAQTSSVKTQRLTEDLEFYLSERRSLMQQLENSRSQ
jgi:hypothetical protein